MKLRCSNYKDCPNKDCYHWKEHEEFFGLDHVGGQGDVKVSRCRPIHTCGLVTPWVEVECLPVETITETKLKAELVPA